MHTATKRRSGFKSSAIHKRKEPHALHYLSERTSFWVASLSLFAFVTGNMIGQHGWHVFWKSVMGKYDDSLIVYEGTVAPVKKIPDYRKWSLYCGDSRAHTFRQVPSDLLIPMPSYKPHDQLTEQDVLENIVFSVDHFGTYDSGGGKGGHVGIDISLPDGTPIDSVMAGMVVKVADQKGGFGKYVLVRHPRVPHPDKPSETTNLYSLYAHLSEVLVSEGTVVHKGDQIALSGMTGNASGPHLHYQLQRETCQDGTAIGDSAFWPFTTTDMRDAGLSFAGAINAGLKRDYGLQCTVNPLAYVQANYKAVQVVQANEAKLAKKVLTVAERRAERVKRQESRRLVALEKQKTTLVAIAQPTDTIVTPVAEVEKTGQVISQNVAQLPLAGDLRGATHLEFRHDGGYSRGWEKVLVRIVDANGNPVRNPSGDFTLRTAYGTAEFRPEVLSPLDFQNGEATVEVLPRGKTTVVIQAHPGNYLSEPMKYRKEE